jgi:hypothetical protein
MTLAYWKASAQKLRDSNPKSFMINKSFCGVLDFIHANDCQGTCRQSSAVLYFLLAAQGIEATLCRGEASIDKLYFDHSWLEIDGNIYDAAISKTLINSLCFPPVFRGIDLSTNEPTRLKFGTLSGLDHDESVRWIRSISVAEYMNLYPHHPDGLYGIVKLVGKSVGVHLSVTGLRKKALHSQWSERPDCKVDSPLGNPPQLRQTVIGVAC